MTRSACAKLLEAERFDSAGAIYFAVEMFKDAIDAYAAGGLWEKAKEVLKKAPKYSEYYESLQMKLAKKPTSAAPRMNEGSSSIEAYAQRGEWEKCIELASAQVLFVSY